MAMQMKHLVIVSLCISGISICGFAFAQSAKKNEANILAGSTIWSNPAFSKQNKATNWYALQYRQDNSIWLTPTKLKFVPRTDDDMLIDVISSASDAALHLSFPNIQSGRVESATVNGRSIDFFKLQKTRLHSIPIQFGTKSYVLTSKFDKQRGYEHFLQILNSKHENQLRQKIAHDLVGVEADSYLSMSFAGDLDRDGKLDLIVERNYYGTGEYCLYLSSLAKVNQLLQSVACRSEG